MKKIVAMVLLALMALSISVSADGFDFSEMSDEELLYLNESLSAELSARNLDDATVLYRGWYYAGKELDAGSYLITRIDDGDEADFGLFVSAKSTARYTAELAPKDSCYITLDDGEILIIWSGVYTIQEWRVK